MIQDWDSILQRVKAVKEKRRQTWDTEEEDLGGGNKVADDEEPKRREQSAYADPIPIPAPKAIDAHLVTGLPTPNTTKWIIPSLVKMNHRSESNRDNTLEPHSIHYPEPNLAINHAKR